MTVVLYVLGFIVLLVLMDSVNIFCKYYDVSGTLYRTWGEGYQYYDIKKLKWMEVYGIVDVKTGITYYSNKPDLNIFNRINPFTIDNRLKKYKMMKELIK